MNVSRQVCGSRNCERGRLNCSKTMETEAGSEEVTGRGVVSKEVVKEALAEILHEILDTPLLTA